MRKTVFSAKAIYSLYVIASALLSAISIILTEIIIQHYSTKPLIIILFGNLLASIIMLLISLITRKKRYPILASWKRQDWVAIIVTSLSTYGLAYLLSFDAVRQIGSSKTALLLLLETPFIVTLGIIFLQERLSFRQWIAFALALVGVVLITFDSSAFNLTLGWGEIEAILSGLSFAIGIVVIKPVLQKVDQFWLTSLLLFLGTVSLGILSSSTKLIIHFMIFF
jgi:drug/metabolite transporter (DMT)-like permease